MRNEPVRPRILGEEDDVEFQYYMFDWDDNILHMPTRIHLEQRTDDGWERISVSTNDFARLRTDTENYRPVDGDWDKSFEDFYDVGRRGDRAFIEDTMAALEPVIQGKETGGPSFRRFRKALTEGRLFAIITARAHAPPSIREGVEYFIEKILTPEEKQLMVRNLRAFNAMFDERDAELTDVEVVDKYLGLNRYHGVTSPEFSKLVGRDIRSGAESPAQAKQLAIREFVNHVLGLVRDRGVSAPISVGFSDDDSHNVKAVETFLEQELAREFPEIRFVIYDTSDPAQPRGRKIIVQGQLELDLDSPPDDA